MLKDRWASGLTLEDFVERAEVNRDLWRTMRRHARVPAELAERLRDLAAPRYLLVLLEDWCGDAVNTVPVLDRLAAEVPGLELRVLRRDENPDLMDEHLSGRARAIPVVMVLDEHFRELGWWGSRPAPLQGWYDSAEARALDRADRYREIRRWYARDRGRTTLAEVAALLGVVAEEDGAGTAPPRVA